MITLKTLRAVGLLARSLACVALVTLALPAVVAQPAAAQQTPETIIRNGRIVTADGRFDDGVILAEPGSGRFIPGAPFRRPVLRPVTNRE